MPQICGLQGAPKAIDLVSTIPDETLCHIFSLVQSIDEIWPRDDPRHIDMQLMSNVPIPHHNPTLGWLNITFVNHRWREVAIEDPLLWTHPTGALGQRWLDEFVRRSKNTPLFVDSTRFPLYTALQGLVSMHSARISALHLDYSVRKDLEELFSSSFDALQRLSLATTDDSPSALDIMNARSPNVRHLRFSFPHIPYTAFDWQIPVLKNVTSLDLALQPELLGFLEWRFLNGLRRMHSLVHLSITEIYRRRTPPIVCEHRCSSAAEDLIMLECIESMIVRAPLETHAHVLRHIRLPSAARLALLSPDLELEASTERTTYDALSQQIKNFIRWFPETPSFKAAFISFTSTDRTSAILSIALTHTAEPQGILPDVEQKGLDRDEWPQTMGDLVMQFHEHQASTFLPLYAPQDIVSLSLVDAQLSSDLAQLSFFSNVERLRVGFKRSKFLHGLHLIQDTTLLPNLRHLDLDGDSFDLAAVLICFILRGAGASEPTLLEAILQTRHRAGKPLQAVYLHVAREIALAKAGRVEETSCQHLQEDVVLGSIGRLEAIQGVRIVDKDFNVFHG